MWNRVLYADFLSYLFHRLALVDFDISCRVHDFQVYAEYWRFDLCFGFVFVRVHEFSPGDILRVSSLLDLILELSLFSRLLHPFD